MAWYGMVRDGVGWDMMGWDGMELIRHSPLQRYRVQSEPCFVGVGARVEGRVGLGTSLPGIISHGRCKQIEEYIFKHYIC